MAGVPYTFATATTSIPLSQLDANFNTQITLGNTTVGLGNTVTTIGNLTLTNVNIVSGTVPTPTSIANGTSNVSISSSGGNINVVTGGTIATFPSAAGTVMVSGNMPAFSAYKTGQQTGISYATWTKVQFPSKNFDTASAFDSTTNYRFTPLVAGYYQLNATAYINTLAVGGQQIAIYKNGSQFSTGTTTTTASTDVSSVVSAVIYLNGSTDYVEVYVYANTAAGTYQTNGGGGGGLVQFSGSMVRTA